MSRGQIEEFQDLLLTPFVTPVSADLFPMLWMSLMGIGGLLMAVFFIYEMSVDKKNKSIVTEGAIAMASSVCLGFGVLFLLLWSGLWV